MASRQWYIANNNQQEGPYLDEQIRDLIAQGRVTADTLVWCEGMSAWAKVAEVPGLMPSAPRPPAMPPRAMPMATGGAGATGPLKTTVRVWPLLGRSILVGLAEIVVIPLPWAATSFFRWFVDNIELPDRQRVTFVGKPGDIWWAFILYALCAVVAAIANEISDSLGNYVQIVGFFAELFFLLVIVRWFFANLAREGQAAPLKFTGGYWAILGWFILSVLSVITIIGWAWVVTASVRWMCRHVEGSRRQLIFTASGWGYLWRALVFVLTAVLIVPIPWTLRWFTAWAVSQFALVRNDTAQTV